MLISPDQADVIINESEFPGCCGIKVAHEAEFDEDHPETYKKGLAELVEDAASIGDEIGQSTGLVLYSLNDSQKIEKEAVLAAGFVPLIDFTNPGHNSHITLYGKKMNQPAPQARRKAPAKRRARH